MIERHELVIDVTGQVTVPDLTTALATALDVDRTPLASRLGGPRFAVAKALALPLPGLPADLTEAELWRWHRRGARLAHAAGPASRLSEGDGTCSDGPTWAAVKLELARRLLGPRCRLCGHRCAVDRRAGQRGRCGLGAALRIGSAVRLWGEEPELGRPGLAFAAIGCGLRCSFCYRPEHLSADSGEACETADLARVIDAADDAAHVHWLGGDPDESLPGILAVHLAARVDRPVVWNTHSYLTPAQTRLLAGFVDGFVADLKFGPGPCAGELAGAADYWPVATAALRRLARGDGHLIVRHVVLPGHLACCTAPVIAWLQQELPGVRVNLLTQYEPWGRARDDPRLGRRLSAAELAVASSLKPVADGSGDDESTDGVVGHALVGLRADLPRE